MQLKFTPKPGKGFRNCAGLLMGLLISGGLFSQQPSSRETHRNRTDVQSRAALKMQAENAGTGRDQSPLAFSDNGSAAFISGRNGININRTEAVCNNFTGTITAADPAFTSGRLNRNGVASSCTTPKTCPGNFSAGSSFRYRTHTFTNPIAFAQCITVTHQNNGAAGSPHLSIHNGPFNPANICTNYLADFGLSPGPGNNATFTFTLPPNATVTLVITETAVGGGGSYNITLDGCETVCTGTPAPGNTISSVPTVCPGINFTLSLQNATAGAGLIYQWEKSTLGTTGPWTLIAGANNATLVTNQTVPTWYRCNITCAGPGGGTGTANPVQVGINPPLSCYCIPTASDCTDDDVITRVRISTLDNLSGCGTGVPAGYSNYTATVAAPEIYRGLSIPITVNVPTIWLENIAVWIDYDQSGTFDTNEFTNLGTNAGTTGSIMGNINVPITALPGITRMRVRTRFNTPLTSGNACLGYGFGETEDYNVNIQACVPVTITGNPSNAVINCGGNASFTATTSGSFPSFQWQYKVAGATAWLNVPAALPFSGQNTGTLTITNTSQTYSGYQFRAMVSGACSALDPSGAATLTVNTLVPVVNPAAPAICTGSLQQLTLTNTIGNTELISEGFNTVVPLPAGWASQNNSTPVGGTSWFQGNPGVFPAQSGDPNAYIGVNFNSVTGANTISNWLITPTVAIKNGDIFRFWTRKATPSNFPDRLEVRMNATNSTNVGATNTSVGDFTNLLLTINPTLTTTGYPNAWTEYIIVVNGLTAPVPAGRFAFRYFVTNGGPIGANSDYIGIDNVGFTSVGGPAQGTWSGPAGTMWTDAAGTIPYTAGTLLNSIWVNPINTTNYTVSFNTITPCASAITNVPVNVSKPAVLGTSPENKAVCVGGSTTFTATGTGGPLTYQWQWSTDGGLTYTNIAGATASTLTVSDITMAMNGYRYRCVISAAPCAGSVTSADAILTVNALPVVTLTSPDLLLTPGQTTSITASSTPAAAAGGWVWNYNGSTIAGNNTNTVGGISIDQIGTYHATVTDVNGCTSSSNDIVIGSEASDRLWIYPNPTTGIFQVRLYYNPASVYEKRAVYIYNAQGQLITSQEFDLMNTTAPYLKMEFNLEKAAAGTYVVKVVHKYTGKVVSGLVVVH